MKKIEELEQKLIEIQNELDELKKQQSKYPMELLYIGDWHCIFPTTDRMELIRKHYMFAQLVETCKEWNRIDEFVPEYDDQRTTIKNFSGTVFISTGILNGAIMLIDYTTAQLFLDTFRNELEQVKDLL